MATLIFLKVTFPDPISLDSHKVIHKLTNYTYDPILKISKDR